MDVITLIIAMVLLLEDHIARILTSDKADIKSSKNHGKQIELQTYAPKLFYKHLF